MEREQRPIEQGEAPEKSGEGRNFREQKYDYQQGNDQRDLQGPALRPGRKGLRERRRSFHRRGSRLRQKQLLIQVATNFCEVRIRRSA